MQIKDILQEKAKDILTEETLTQIQEAFDEKVKLQVEAALVRQDDEYSTKLENLLEAIDIDHTKKLDKVVEAIDKNHAGKMITVVERYSKALTGEADTFKNVVINKVSKYLDVYLEKLTPQKSINEAVKNKRAAKMLSEMRSVLAIDAALQKNSIRGAIKEGKKRIDESTSKVDTISATLDKLTKENAVLKAQLTLEQKCLDLPDDKSAFCKKVLGNKSHKFIVENFDYTLKMFDKNHDEHLEVLHEQAKNQNMVTKEVDRPAPQVLNESAKGANNKGNDPYFSAYLGELNKY